VAQALPAREQSPAPEPEEASAAQSEPDPVLAADSEPSPDTESPSSGAEAEPAVPMSAGDTAEAPVNLADVLRRVGADAVLSDDADTPDEPPPRRAAGRAAAETPATPPHDDGGEESINQYMERLMQRVRGGTASETSARWAQSPASSASSDSRRSTETEATPAEPRHARARATDAKPAAPRDTESSQIVPAEPRQRPTGNMSPRTVAPEKGGGLAAMRELAQYTAHNALNQHARNQLVTTIRTKLLVTLLGLGTGVALFWLHRRPGANQTALYAAVVSLMVAVIWGIQYATLTGHLIVRKVGRIEWKWSTSAAPQVPAAGTPGD
jgi:hypothetical protein